MITIDGKTYDARVLSEHAKQQIASMQFVDGEIAKLQATLAVFQTARMGYSNALKAELNKTPEQLLPQNSGTIQFN